jgi:hypothetical protein
MQSQRHCGKSSKKPDQLTLGFKMIIFIIIIQSFVIIPCNPAPADARGPSLCKPCKVVNIQ